MNPSPTLEVCGLTHCGMVRSHNEDNHVVNAADRFVILADGMGGYNAGEVASEMAVTQIAAGLSAGLATASPCTDNNILIKAQIEKVNGAIFRAAQCEPHYAGMGTTLVAALFHADRVTVAHVGDSRLYRCRGERFEVITRDHSLLQEQIDSGMITPKEAHLSQNKNLVTRALGVDAGVEVDVAEYEAEPGDLYLLCSDGLNDMVEDADIERALRAGAGDLPGAAQQLVRMANDNGGRDNVTVILVRVAREAPPRGVIGRIFQWIRRPA